MDGADGGGKDDAEEGWEENGMYAVGYEKVEEKEEFGTQHAAPTG